MSARHPLNLLIIVGLFFIPAAPLFADINDGTIAIQKGQFEKAYSEWKPLAEKGETIAEAAIGVMYHAGQGVAQDYVEAIRWYRRAAEKGNVASQANLGVMYSKGVGVERDLVQAYVWYDLAATLGGEARHARSRDHLAKQMNREQLAQAKQQAREYAVKYVAPFRRTGVKP